MESKKTDYRSYSYAGKLLDDARVALNNDPLMDVARKERRNVLAVSILIVLLCREFIDLSEFSLAGAAINGKEENSILSVLLVLDLYFLLAFMFYGISDFVPSRGRYLQIVHNEVTSHFKGDPEAEVLIPEHRKYWISYFRFMFRITAKCWIRILFDLVLPFLLGLSAIMLGVRTLVM